ncbi:hypothetical protein [Okeania sp. KiyG1]|nr:hypothetical protein [Okeania sp. KiyG1]
MAFAPTGVRREERSKKREPEERRRRGKGESFFITNYPDII